MTRAPSEQQDLIKVSAWFTQHRLSGTRFAKPQTRSGKTPDFRIMHGNSVVAYCEVKSPRDEWLDDLVDQAAPAEIVGGVRKDPVFNRLSSLMEKAVEQFDSVNLNRALPNILVFVNHDAVAGRDDLFETLTGRFRAANGSRPPTAMYVAEGRIRDLKRRIDLYVWMDGGTGKVQLYFFGSRDHVDALCRMLSLDKSKIMLE